MTLCKALFTIRNLNYLYVTIYHLTSFINSILCGNALECILTNLTEKSLFVKLRNNIYTMKQNLTIPHRVFPSQKIHFKLA